MLRDNEFDGELPASINSLGKLEVLNLEENVIRGRLPSGFAESLLSLRVLNLSRNFFAGPIPANIGRMSQLIEIRLSTNFADPVFGFTGPIPASIGLLGDLLRLDLNENRLTGTLPSQIGFLQNLQLFNVGFNPSLAGTIPTEYGNLDNLKAFYIIGTGINGVVPGAMCSSDPFIQIDCSDQIACSCCACSEGEEE